MTDLSSRNLRDLQSRRSSQTVGNLSCKDGQDVASEILAFRYCFVYVSNPLKLPLVVSLFQNGLPQRKIA